SVVDPGDADRKDDAVMRCVCWSELDEGGRKAALTRPSERSDPRLVETVRRIIDDVRAHGWTALERHSVSIDREKPTRIEAAPLAKAARTSLGSDFVAALELAAANISHFHEETRPLDVTVETMPGVKVSKCWRPVDHAGLYVPGGSAPLFSTLLMLALPARAAGVGRLTI